MIHLPLYCCLSERFEHRLSSICRFNICACHLVDKCVNHIVKFRSSNKESFFYKNNSPNPYGYSIQMKKQLELSGWHAIRNSDCRVTPIFSKPFFFIEKPLKQFVISSGNRDNRTKYKLKHELTKTVGSARRLLKYCELQNIFPAILRGIFGIFRGVSRCIFIYSMIFHGALVWKHRVKQLL